MLEDLADDLFPRTAGVAVETSVVGIRPLRVLTVPGLSPLARCSEIACFGEMYRQLAVSFGDPVGA